MFFSSVAHELRTPLNSIIPITRMLKSTLSSDMLAQKYLQIIINSALHLQNIVDDALDMSRIENGRFIIDSEYFDIREAVNEVVTIMRFQASQKRITLTVHISNEVPKQIKTDHKRFRQILFNLIGNAIKFTFAGGINVTLDY